MSVKICHITTVHPRYDVRIFHKECKSLAKLYDVHLIVADGKGDEIAENVHIHDIGKPKSRKERVLQFTKSAYKKAVSVDASVYHFHDPELLSVGVKLARHGKRVVYDSHEDLPRQILTKPWIPKFLRGFVSRIVEFVENRRVRKMSAVVTATPHIQERFQKVTAAPVVSVCNYPIINEITDSTEWTERQRAVCYVGGLFRERGIFEMVRAVGKAGVRLKLAGSFSPASLQAEVEKESDWKQVDYQGFVGRKEINALLGESMAGLLLLHPMPSYIASLPIKLFEYMAAGIPVICSDFKLWRDIVEGSGCGVCVNPFDIEKVAAAIRDIVDNPVRAHEMGANGHRAVLEKYNWNTQSEILLDLYNSLLDR